MIKNQKGDQNRIYPGSSWLQSVSFLKGIKKQAPKTMILGRQLTWM